MNKRNNPRLFLIIFLFFAILSGCITPNIMLNHHPESLSKIPIDSTMQNHDFTGKEIILTMDYDLTTQPIGAYFYDSHFNTFNAFSEPSRGNSVLESYVMSKPGYVLFEKIADVLRKQHATIYRRYFQKIPLIQSSKNAALSILIGFNDVEFHLWVMEKKDPVYLARAMITWSFDNAAKTGSPDTVTIQSKVNTQEDIFEKIAQKFSAVLYYKLKEGGQI